ncbi:MAG: rhodanese-like domain-containing protein [Anaerolineales bacterium]|jgi:rhodanese-related sulfurtransferase
MKKLSWIMTLIMLLGVVLSACGGGNTAAEEPAAVENNTAENNQVEEPEPEGEVEEVEEPVEFDVASLDAAFDIFLDDMEGYNTISLDALNTAMVETPPFLLDVRNTDEVEGSGHIEGSVLIPLRDLADNLAYLPSFDTPIVSYCGSGWRCTIALTMLEAMGWEDVKGLKGGSFTGWMDEGYTYVEGLEPEAEMLNGALVDPAMAVYFDSVLEDIVPEGWGVVTAENLNTMIVENPDLVMIDVRTAAEVDENGSIDAPNIQHIPLQEFIDRKAEWPAQDAPVVVYCGSGHRSTIAAAILWTYGYIDVGSLKGGFGGWAAEGYAKVGGALDLDAAYTAFLADMEGYNTISLDGLNTALVENPPFLLDVRNPEEVEKSGHIEGSVLVPLVDLAEKLAYLPSFDTPIVSYCGSGWRCTIALTALEAIGWEDVKGLKGGSFTGWLDGGYAYVDGLETEAEMLNTVDVSPATTALFDDVFNRLSAGWGVVTADALNTLLVENPDVILIDVRTEGELAEKGVIENTNWAHITLETFIEHKADWPADKDTKIVVYCGSGHRSTIAMTILSSYGYTDVGSLKGGFGGWAADGYPVGEYTAP